MCRVAQAVAPTPLIPGIGPVGPVELVYTGFSVAEGPTCDRNGNLFFTNIHTANGILHKLDLHGRLTTVFNGTDRANGLCFNAQGEIVACQMNGRVVAYSPDGSMRVLADNFQGRRFNAPNDLAIDLHGGIYFTDPVFGAGPVPPQILHKGVYYISPPLALPSAPGGVRGEVSRVINNLPNPNGITFSPDHGILYVVCSFCQEVNAYPVLGPGKLGPARVFCKLKRSRLPIFVGGDGATVDADGNLYVTSCSGIQVFNAHGQMLGIIDVPDCPTNVAFGGTDGRTLYITTWHSLYRARMLTGRSPGVQ